MTQWSVPFSGVDRSPLENEGAEEENRAEAQCEAAVRGTRSPLCTVKRNMQYYFRGDAELAPSNIAKRGTSSFSCSRDGDWVARPAANTHREHDHRAASGGTRRQEGLSPE